MTQFDSDTALHQFADGTFTAAMALDANAPYMVCTAYDSAAR
jgi:hypothetical protein